MGSLNVPTISFTFVHNALILRRLLAQLMKIELESNMNHVFIHVNVREGENLIFIGASVFICLLNILILWQRVSRERKHNHPHGQVGY